MGTTLIVCPLNFIDTNYTVPEVPFSSVLVYPLSSRYIHLSTFEVPP